MQLHLLFSMLLLTPFQGHMLTSSASAGRPFFGTFMIFSRPFTRMVSQFVGAADALCLSAIWPFTRARLIDPVFHTIRSHVMTPVLVFSKRGYFFLASLLPASMTGTSPLLMRFEMRWPNALLLGLLVLSFPLRRFMSAASARARS